MEELAIFRIFSSFPLFGLLLPDLSSLFIYPPRGISGAHIYVEGFLLLGVVICTAGIWRSQRKIKSTNSIQITHGS
ncbi:hypothetical protein SNE25_13460 [Mucilaginibacter sabulilitoris]|uniref:Uncharacterized protein n=1 Tax=Mucilaginibacter sabulilitoris TaxID=1173583 RepID=A0ABZ0TU20_9SPHI|nr:hypothetical protein [Mucilaginibacter sabulilitoris]WPU96526.1 hypothetical protein SNE25_13460 [Mucilaginibacter sabulilitoris]